MNHLGFLVILLLHCFLTNAILFAIPAQHVGTSPPTLKARPTYNTNKIFERKVRIRSTKDSDIDDIAALLASTLHEPCGEFNWKASLDTLRRVKSFKHLIGNRFYTLLEGKKAISTIDASILSDESQEAERLRIMWNCDSFRSLVQTAAEQSKEPHAWTDHNFALCPEDLSYLQHKMFTVQDAASGSILGFCEVAMMLTPNTDNCDMNPTIANLVTSPEYRRCGIGSSLLASVKRYVKQNWRSEKLALYVKRSNARAIGLYQKQGFEEYCTVDDREECYYIVQ